MQRKAAKRRNMVFMQICKPVLPGDAARCFGRRVPGGAVTRESKRYNTTWPPPCYLSGLFLLYLCLYSNFRNSCEIQRRLCCRGSVAVQDGRNDQELPSMRSIHQPAHSWSCIRNPPINPGAAYTLVSPQHAGTGKGFASCPPLQGHPPGGGAGVVSPANCWWALPRCSFHLLQPPDLR